MQLSQQLLGRGNNIIIKEETAILVLTMRCLTGWVNGESPEDSTENVNLYTKVLHYW